MRKNLLFLLIGLVTGGIITYAVLTAVPGAFWWVLLGLVAMLMGGVGYLVGKR